MTGNPAPSTEPPHEPASRASQMVRLIRESWALVEPRSEEVTRYFYAMLFSLAPATRDLFAVNMQVQRSRLLRAVVHTIQTVDRPDELLPFLHQLGRDHRKFGVTPQYYEALGTALLAAIKKYSGAAWTEAVERAWAEAYTVMASAMTEAAAADVGPAFYTGEVVYHERLGWDLAIIQVRALQPVPYEPGEYVSVETPQRPRLWRYLSPANAPRPDGILEFHVRAVEGGWVSRALVSHARLGDRWRIGSPMGRLRVDRTNGRDVVMIAGGTGVAPMHSIIEDLSRYRTNPRVHLFYGGRTPDDLYDLRKLQQAASIAGWLTVTPVLEQDPEAVGAERGTLADVVTRYGAWTGRDVLIAGSPAMLRATVSRMLVAGTPLDHIHYDPFTLD